MLLVFLTFIICRLHKLTVTEQAQFTLQVRVFPIWCKDFCPSAPCWGPEKFFSTRTETRFWSPCRRGRFETSMVVRLIIAKLLISAFITNIL